VLHCDTTGLDTNRDEIIGLSILKFAYSDDSIDGIVDAFASFHQPSASIGLEIIAQTRITDEMVRDGTIDFDAVVHFIADASVIIAHNTSLACEGAVYFEQMPVTAANRYPERI
jgi:DNA polymerase-3 subunit epsilon